MCRLRKPTMCGASLTSLLSSRLGRPTNFSITSYGTVRIACASGSERTSGESRTVPARSTVTRGLPST